MENDVIEVDNQLTVKSCETKNDVVMAAKVNKLPDEVEAISNESVRFEVRDRIVSLTGDVRTDTETARALDIAAGVKGVKHVNNYLMVNPHHVAANRQHRKMIMECMKQTGMENQTSDLLQSTKQQASMDRLTPGGRKKPLKGPSASTAS